MQLLQIETTAHGYVNMTHTLLQNLTAHTTLDISKNFTFYFYSKFNIAQNYGSLHTPNVPIHPIT
jgi:hypothetical protein